MVKFLRTAEMLKPSSPSLEIKGDDSSPVVEHFPEVSEYFEYIDRLKFDLKTINIFKSLYSMYN